MTTQLVSVLGMACRACETFVSDELLALDGVTAVAVDLTSGTVTITAARSLDAVEIRDAVERAGYEATGWALSK